MIIRHVVIKLVNQTKMKNAVLFRKIDFDDYFKIQRTFLLKQSMKCSEIDVSFHWKRGIFDQKVSTTYVCIHAFNIGLWSNICPLFLKKSISSSVFASLHIWEMIHEKIELKLDQFQRQSKRREINRETEK